MDQLAIETVLLDQREELEMMKQEKFISRPEEDKINLKSKLAQVVIGVRRSGKSTLCFNALEKAGVNYAYVNFDDERLVNISSEDLDKVLEVLYKIYGRFEYLLLDEIQNVDGWPLFVNRLLRQWMHLVITGSNAKLLSSELASHLTGRHHTIELFPFSFKEWCMVKEINFNNLTTQNKGLLQRALNEYIHIGGFPELIFEGDSRAYINSLYHDIISQDIRKRFKIRNEAELLRISNHILNEVPNSFKVDRLMEIGGIKSRHTVAKYLSYLQQTYLLSKVCRYSTKSRFRSVDDKYYAIDVAFMDKRENAFAKENIGWRLETIVYLELLRRYPSDRYDIYYLKDKTWETDFIVCEGSRTESIYQVSYDISSEKTRKRELRGCVLGAKATRCSEIYLITDHENEDIEVKDCKIKIRPAYRWLIE